MHPSTGFNIAPSDYGRRPSMSYGRTPSSQYHRDRRDHYYDGAFPMGQGSTPYMPPGTYDPQYHSSLAHRQPSMNQYGSMYNSDMPPLEEYYDEIPSRHHSRGRSRRRSLSQGYIPGPVPTSQVYATSDAYPPLQIPTSADGYRSSYRRGRSRSYDRSSYSDRSYSDDSLSSRDRYYDNGYSTVYPSATNPTVIQPSYDHPIVVPINGGNGGYVVVPPVGQKIRVVVSLETFLRRCNNTSTDCLIFNRIPPDPTKTCH